MDETHWTPPKNPLGSGVGGECQQAEESQQDGGQEQHSSSHEWRFKHYEWQSEP